MIYDWLLTLDREINYVWRSRAQMSLMKVTFVYHRYFVLAVLFFVTYSEWCFEYALSKG